MTFCEEVDYLVKAEAQLKGTTLKTAEARIAGRLGVAPSTVQRWRYRKRADGFKPRSKTPRGVSVENSVCRAYLRLQKQKVFHKPPQKLPTLHIVCSPGGGAFSVYMFIRYALAQRDHFKARVKMTMLCRQEEDGTIKAERWWNNWLSDEGSRQCLKVPDGWAPQFIRKENDLELFGDFHYTKEIFILAGGEQGRLIQAFWHLKGKKGNHQQVVLLTEEDLVKYYNEEFAFQPAFDNKNTLLPRRNNLKPQECLDAVEKAHKARLDELLNSPRDVGPIKPVGHQIDNKNGGTFKVHWEKDVQFFEHEPTRLIVNVRPKFTSVNVQDSFQYDDTLKVKWYVKHYIEGWFDWRKSLRFKIEEKFEEKLSDFFTRRPDARKLFMYNSDKESSRGKKYSRNSILFSHPNESTGNQSRAKALIIMAWDSKNIGRSTQLLSQTLETLEKDQNLVLLDFSAGNDNERTAQSSLIVQSLQYQDGQPTIYNEDLEKLKTSSISTTNCLKSESYSSFLLSTIGMNGPSLRIIIDLIDSSKDMQLLEESDLEGQSNNLKPLSVHRAFIRGIFPTKSLGERYLKMEGYENQWLIQAGEIRYITWLAEDAFVSEKDSYLPNRLMCTMDSDGRVHHVFDVKQNEALEVLLYIALWNIENVAKGRFFTSTPNPEGFETKTMFKRSSKTHSDIGQVQFPNMGSTQNAEIWFTELKDGEFRHFVGDSKAIYHTYEISALDKAEDAFTSLMSKYNWKTLHGHIRVVMLSFFGGHNSSLTDDNPFIFSKQTYFRVKEDNSKRSLEKIYSIDVSHFSNYVKSFIRKYQKNVTPISYEEYRGNVPNVHSNFDAELPFHQSESIPKKNQTSRYFFRKNPSHADGNSHSGFFFDPDTHDFQNAFYFHNKSLREVDEYVSSKVTDGRSELSEDDNELLMRLVQITTVLGIESPTQEQQNRGYLSKWADEVLYHLYRKADENMTYDSEKPPKSLHTEAVKIFHSASESAKNKAPQCIDKFLDFIRGLRSFTDSFSIKAPRRYHWYVREKARRSSQSSQSGA